MKISSGDSVGRYHILEPLGEGGMAAVYKAYDTRLEREVAIKFLRTELFGSAMLEQLFKRFEREAKALARLSHFHIVKIHDFGEHDDMPYLVMEYVPGGTLKSRMGKPVPWQEAFSLLLPVARALEYAHQHGVLHRDVKPSNILITEGGEPLLSDFGIAKILESSDSQAITTTGVGIGTPEYMAPEQGLAQNVDARTDVYGLGIVLYEMLTGRKPYTADTPTAVLIKQVHDPLPDPRVFAIDMPETVERVLLKSLAKQPENRYASMAEFARAMDGLLNPLQPTPQAEKPVEPTLIVDWHPKLEEPPATQIRELSGEKAGGRMEGASLIEEMESETPPVSVEAQAMPSGPADQLPAPPEASAVEDLRKTIAKKRLRWIWIAAPAMVVAVVAGLVFWRSPPESTIPTSLPTSLPTLLPVLPSLAPAKALPPTALPALQNPPSQETLKIGILAPLSGDVQSFGASSEMGVKLAVDQWNERGGILGMRILPVFMDDMCSRDRAIDAVNTLIEEEKVNFLIGGVCSQAAIPEAEVANQRQVIQIATAATNMAVTVDEHGNTRPFTFRACLVDPFQGMIAARFARENLEAKRVFSVFEENSQYEMSLAEAFSNHFKALGGEYAGTITYAVGQDDFSMIMKMIEEVHPDVIYLPAYYNVVNPFIAQARENGIRTTFVGSDGWDSPDLDWKIAGGSFFTSHYWSDDPRPEVEKFRVLFSERYRNEQGDPLIPDSIAVLSYDATNLLLHAIEQAGSIETDAVRDALERISFPGVTGEIRFDDQHNPIKPAVILEVTPDGLRFVTSITP